MVWSSCPTLLCCSDRCSAVMSSINACLHTNILFQSRFKSGLPPSKIPTLFRSSHEDIHNNNVSKTRFNQFVLKSNAFINFQISEDSFSEKSKTESEPPLDLGFPDDDDDVVHPEGLGTPTPPGTNGSGG